VDKFTPVEDNIGLLETTFDEDVVLMFMFPKDVMGSINLTRLVLFIGVTAISLSPKLLMQGAGVNLSTSASGSQPSVKKTVKRKVWKPTGNVFTNIGNMWRPTGRTFTIVGNACPLTRITTTARVPLRKPIALESNPPKPMVTLVYSRKPKASRNNVPVSKFKINKSLSTNKKEPNKC
nr:hypothetical protein [Tanacetum cinerariifolium]